MFGKFPKIFWHSIHKRELKNVENAPKNNHFFASVDMSYISTHRIVIRECDGNRSSKCFTCCAKGLTAKNIYDELFFFNEKYLVDKLKSDLVLMNQNTKNKTHSVSIIPIKKNQNDREITLYLSYPHYSCRDVAIELQAFLWHGSVNIK